MPASEALSHSNLGPVVGLAASSGGVIRSGSVINPMADASARLSRAKERLYVICQVGGWGAFFATQVGFSQAFADSTDGPHDSVRSTAILGMVTLLGLLLTHYARRFTERWGWKSLNWRTLVVRVLLLAAVLSLLWSAIGYGYCYLLVHLPWPSKYSPGLVFFISWFNGSCLFVGWFCLYFFYHVLERLQRMQVEQLRLAATVKEAELRALKSQVNPHFLFNSLNSLRALIDEDAPRAREAVTRLANMLRYSLQSSQLEMVSFEEELRIVEDYLALEQIRHESRLRVRWDIPAETRLVQVPPMLLQTLVENAVKYGISTRREGGELQISARIEGTALKLQVTNPGDLASPASPAAARAGSSTGVGLRNASDRLKLLFGDLATLTLVAEPVGYVTAHVLIPLNLPRR